jgi:hypothetical protein
MVACKITSSVHPGKQITATYTITSNRTIKVGIGAGVYDSAGVDQSTGYGDLDGYQLTPGTQEVTRVIEVPSGLPAGHYEIGAEVWPSGKIGADGTEVLAEGLCGYFTSPS